MNATKTMTKAAIHIPSDVTCEHCVRVLRLCPTNEYGFPLARQMFAVGNPARTGMGHAQYFTSTGQIALCIAKPR